MQDTRNRTGELSLEDEKFLNKTRKELRKASTKELMALAKSDELIDSLIDESPRIKRLTLKLAQLSQQVLTLADFNYAREPVLNRQRAALQRSIEEVSSLRSRITQRHVKPIMKRLNELQIKLSTHAKSLEDESDRMAQDLLEGRLAFEDCLERYLKTRKETSKQQILADRLAKEKDKLAQTVTTSTKFLNQRKLVETQQDKPPSPMPRTKKRASMNR